MTRALFMGTPVAAVPALAALTGVADVVGVVTQPDAARGRSKHKISPPVKVAAEEWGFPVYQPATRSELQSTVDEAEFDVGVVVAYGRLLTPEVLAVAQFGYLNVHFSLLPRWRGAAPVERSIVAGDESTGVSLMKLDEGLDTGPVVAVREAAIVPEDTAGTLTARLAHVGADVLIDSLPDYVAGRRMPAPQISAGVSEAPRLTTAEAQLHGAIPVERAERMIRGFNPRPGAWLTIGAERLKVFAAAYADHRVPVGTLTFIEDRPVVGFQGGSLELISVQPAGHKVMTGRAWGNGRRHEPGTLDSAPSAGS